MDTHPEIPEKLAPILRDLASDLQTTFPEYAEVLQKYTVAEMPKPLTETIFNHILAVFPERMFDILYQNDDIFAPGSTVNTVFLPEVDFKWFFQSEGVSETTRNAIWKYLQLIMVSIIGCIPNRSMFGNTADLFENMESEDLQQKLTETVDGISEFFKHLSETKSGETGDDAFGSNDDEAPDLLNEEDAKKFFENMGNAMPQGAGNTPGFEMPDVAGLHEHLKGLFEGKIGTLAKELAEEIAKDLEATFGFELSGAKTAQDLLKKLVQNPKKLMDLMKTIGAKLKEKMKSGDISEEDIMKEAGEILGKMKGMGGKDGKMFGELFKNLAKGAGSLGSMGLGGKNSKMAFNSGAFDKMFKNMAAKERLERKLEARRANVSAVSSDEYVFTVEGEEKQEKSRRPPATNSAGVPLHELSIDDLAAEIGDVQTDNVQEVKKKKSKSKSKK